MNPDRRFWDELLLVAEESFAAFSGVSPDLIGHSLAIPKACHPETAGSVLQRTNGRPAQDSAVRRCGRQSSIKGGEEAWRAGCN